MIRPSKLKQYYATEYPELVSDKLDEYALINSIDLLYNDERDIERKYAQIEQLSAGELTARSVSLRNLLYINQQKLWETLGWSSISAVSIDYKAWTCLGAVIVLLKDFVGLLVHNFSPIETNVLYAIYKTGSPNNPYFTDSEVAQTYAKLFDSLSAVKLKSVLAYFVELQVIEDEGHQFAIRQEIRLNSHFRY